jgi:hypothetical protein
MPLLLVSKAPDALLPELQRFSCLGKGRISKAHQPAAPAPDHLLILVL